jgi:hypothetical protein
METIEYPIEQTEKETLFYDLDDLMDEEELKRTIKGRWLFKFQRLLRHPFKR